MARRLKITIASILVLAIVGCSGEDDGSANVEPAPNQTAENNPSQTAEPFNDPVVPSTQTKPTIARAPSTLIQPTNPTERVGVVSRGRKDPFDEIVPPPKFPTKKPEGATANKPKPRRAVPQLPPLPASRTTIASRSRRRIPGSRVNSANRGGIGSTGGRSLGTNSTSSARQNIQKTTPKPKVPVVPKVMPGVVPQPDLASVLPPPPQPKLAQAVLVSGVVQVGNQPQAIIKVPSEPTSRYVQAGQRLASGLLVKRIEMNEGSEPIVILEQYGIEVARMVGEAPTGASQPATASTEESVSSLPSLPKSASVDAS